MFDFYFWSIYCPFPYKMLNILKKYMKGKEKIEERAEAYVRKERKDYIALNMIYDNIT
jgi:hypothetical protein